ncbi:hypothetical protein MMC07_007392 [Pseudocyphellaria aurata]|nr:hypothetical protein [Pseudocyphellaria aurata]
MPRSSKKRTAEPPPPTSRKKLKSNPAPSKSTSSSLRKPGDKQGGGDKEGGDEEGGEEGENKVPGGGSRTSGGEEFWEISEKRRVTISSFGNRRAVDLREFYDKEGEMLPGKKGISLTLDQFNAVVSFLPYIETVLANKYGEKNLTRPDYSSRVDGSDGETSDQVRDKDVEEEQEEEEDDEAKVDARPRKKNFEATSEEE